MKLSNDKKILIIGLGRLADTIREDDMDEMRAMMRMSSQRRALFNK